MLASQLATHGRDIWRGRELKFVVKTVPTVVLKKNSSCSRHFAELLTCYLQVARKVASLTEQDQLVQGKLPDDSDGWTGDQELSSGFLAGNQLYEL